MQTKQIIQASANVIRITNITKGNIYKRFDDSYTWYGIVKGVHNDGVNTIIEAIEYRSYYGLMSVQNKIIRGKDDCVIFPATLDDMKLEFDGVVEGLNQKIKQSKEEIVKAEEQIEFTNKLLSGEMQKELSTPDFKEMPQSEYDAKLQELAA